MERQNTLGWLLVLAVLVLAGLAYAADFQKVESFTASSTSYTVTIGHQGCNLVVSNDGATYPAYVNFVGTQATVAAGFPLKAGEVVSLPLPSTSVMSVVCDGEETTAVRVLAICPGRVN